MPRSKNGEERIGAWGRLVQERPSQRYARAHTIYTPNDPAEYLMLLSSGRVRLYTRSSTGRVLTLRLIEEGHLFGHVAICGADNYDTFAEALRAVRLYRIDHTTVSALLHQDPDLRLRLLDSLGQHYLSISQRLNEVAFKTAPARLASLLLNLAGSHSDADQLSLPRHSHRQLAEMINSYRETVTKIINEFRAARLLEVNRSTITLINRPRLEEVAQS